MLIDSDGYIKVIDFGMTRILYPGQMATTQCGTPAYMAPEIFKGNGYTYTCDFWCVGIVMYEMLMGTTPFGKNKPSSTIKWGKKVTPSENFKDLCSKLLKVDPLQRIGCEDGPMEILEHAWFEDIDIAEIEAKAHIPGYLPEQWNETDEHHYFSMKTGADVIRQSVITEADRRKVENQKALFEQFQVIGGGESSEEDSEDDE